MKRPLDIVFLGLSLSSAWGNGHATTYRALIRGLAARGHRVTFLEREQPWYAEHRDRAPVDFCALRFYDSLEALRRHRDLIAGADAVIVGSYVPDGIAVARFVQAAARGVVAFYDIDTPVTLASVERGDCAYLERGQISLYDLYLSFTGGPVLARLVESLGAKRAAPLYCSVDPALHRETPHSPRYALGYLGTYSRDRQPALERLLIGPARAMPSARFVVAGALYPDGIDWPENVERIEHVAPEDHAAFYASCRFSLNLTRAEMRAAGYSPSVRLFESAACGSALISDDWPGLDQFFIPGEEITVVGEGAEVIDILSAIPDRYRATSAARARARVMRDHSGAARAAELEALLLSAAEAKPAGSRAVLPAIRRRLSGELSLSR